MSSSPRGSPKHARATPNEKGRSRAHPPLDVAGLVVESTPGHYRVLRDGKLLRRANGMPVTLPLSPDTTRWRHTAIIELRKLGIDV